MKNKNIYRLTFSENVFTKYLVVVEATSVEEATIIATEKAICNSKDYVISQDPNGDFKCDSVEHMKKF